LYIGLAARQSFERVCFAPQKINNYNDDALAGTRVRPLLFLIAKRTRILRFARPSRNNQQHADIVYLEKLMIGMGLEKNPQLKNIANTRLLRGMCVPCLINAPQGRPSSSERDFARTIR